MEDQWTERLSEYLDDELTPVDRAQVSAHLAVCAECAATLDELRAVAAAAAALPLVPPGADLWPGIGPRLEPRSSLAPFLPRMTRRVTFTLPQLVAAGLALMVLSGGAVWISQFGGRATSLPPVAASGNGDFTPASLSDARYDQAIADLEQALAAGRAKLDPETVRVLESNLQAIDRAIEQSRHALAKDPANEYLNSHLADAQQRKLTLLRRASALVGQS